MMNYTLQAKERQVGQLLGAPVIVQGWSWLPVNEILLWAVMSWKARRDHPGIHPARSFWAGALTMIMVLGSEWLHNLAHVFISRRIGRPVDAIRVQFGMPLLIYTPESDRTVRPVEHIIRALGGPAFNAVCMLAARIFRLAASKGSIARSVLDAAVWTNTFLSTMSFLPVPGIDGGSILHWSAVSSGKTREEANDIVVHANRITAIGLGVAGATLFHKRRWLDAAVCSLFGILSLLAGLRILKEKMQ